MGRRPFKPRESGAGAGELYHLADARNVDSILRLGLWSTARLLEAAGIPDDERAARLRRHRPANEVLPTGAVVRDQRPMPPALLAPALTDGWTPGDWYALLNGFVFLWASRDRVARHLVALRAEPQVLLVLDGARLLEDHGHRAFVSPINSGNARRAAVRRGPSLFVPYDRWKRCGWVGSGRPRSAHPVEIVFADMVPVSPPYLLDVEPVATR